METIMEFQDYHFNTIIYESAHTTVYRGIRKSDQLPVIIKMLKDTFPSPEDITRYQREYEITNRFDHEGIIKLYDLIKFQSGLMIISEDFGGQSLKSILLSHTFSTSQFLRLVIPITKIIEEIHSAGIIHKDITNANIIYNLDTDQLKIIDFGVSSEFPRDKKAIYQSEVIEGTLSYISPEQTGRMNRPVDYRTDFYSMGVCFYELLTHRLPFVTDDPLKLIHCHLAKQPLSPNELDLDIPVMVSNIVMKLLSKSADDRYQSAQGLRFDLEHCLKLLETHGEINPFQPGEHDIPDQFRIPKTFYGREQEIESLTKIFYHVFHLPSTHKDDERLSSRSDDNTELIMIIGPPGIGKSALAHHFRNIVFRHQGIYLSGKYEQFQKNKPYSGIVSAFSDLVKQILSETNNRLDSWRTKIIQALGQNGQIIVDIIPELELIIGKQPPMMDLPAEESQNRFHFVFQNFIMAFASSEYPMVLFLDDLHWIDSASQKLIQMLATAKDKKILIIGSYREFDMGDSHPFIGILNDIQQYGINVHYINLKPLALPHIQSFISDSLNCDKDKIAPLSQVILDKTNGNPFFVKEFFKSVYEEKLLTYKNKEWQWHIDAIQEMDFTQNVVELLIEKIQKLPQDAQDLLKLAACIGSRFSLSILTTISGKQDHIINEAFNDALNEGIIKKENESDLSQKTEHQNEYRFAYNRIQQAAYSMMPDQDRRFIHRLLGHLLLKTIPTDKLEEKIFDIVDHLNMGISFLYQDDPNGILLSERIELAKLNFNAGNRAKASTAYDSALLYLKIGIGLLGEEKWNLDYNLCLSLFVNAAESAYLSGDMNEMERLIEEVLAHAQTFLDKVKVYEVKLLAYKMQGKKKDAIQTGLKVLNMLGVILPENPGKLDFLISYMNTVFSLSGRRLEDIAEYPLMKDPIKLASVRILSVVGAASYAVVPKMLPLVVFKQVQIHVKYGNTSVAPSSYAAYGLILSGIIGDIDSAYRFGQLSLKLLERFQTKENKASAILRIACFTMHWKEHIANTIPLLTEACQCGLETGDIEFSAYTMFSSSIHAIFSGRDLVKLDIHIKKYIDLITPLNQPTAIHYNASIRQIVLNMIGDSEKPCHLKGRAFDEERNLPDLISANDRTVVFGIYFSKLYLNYIFYNYEKALEYAELSGQYLDGALATIMFPIYHFFDALTRLALYDSLSNKDQKRVLKYVEGHLKKLKNWSSYAPMNYLHLYKGIEAEIYRVLNQDHEAIEAYEQAISLALENGFLNDEALLNELMAKFYTHRNKSKLAQPFILEARYCFLKWGARAKVQDLDQRYPRLLSSPSLMIRDYQADTTATTASTIISMGGDLDLASVMKASRIISGEIVLDRLLEKLMKIVIENAGAKRCFLILKQDKGFTIEAYIDGSNNDDVCFDSISLEKSKLLSIKIVNYVARTNENIVIEDASDAGRFSGDMYILNHKPKSILCIPIHHHGDLTGILYLENNQVKGAFTPRRVEVLKLLASQAAISIENAKFYTKLEELVKARTAELSIAMKEQKERARELSLLNNMSDLLNACQDEKETHRVIHNICVELFPNDSGYMYIIHPHESSLEQVAGWGKIQIESKCAGTIENCEILNRRKQKSSSYSHVLSHCKQLNDIENYEYSCIPIIAGDDVLGIFHIRFACEHTDIPGDTCRRTMKARQMVAVRMIEQYALFLFNLRLRETLRIESIIDPLTGLYNRRYMEKSLEREASRCKRHGSNLGIIMIDIDYFKSFNDSYGHDAGDAVLQHLGNLLKKSVRKEDIACRYGGEEFILIMPDSFIENTIRRAEELRYQIQNQLKVHFKGDILEITASLGVSSLGEHGPLIKDMMFEADNALYRAKELGRNQVVVAPHENAD